MIVIISQASRSKPAGGLGLINHKRGSKRRGLSKYLLTPAIHDVDRDTPVLMLTDLLRRGG
jgi:hypothetical protein